MARLQLVSFVILIGLFPLILSNAIAGSAPQLEIVQKTDTVAAYQLNLEYPSVVGLPDKALQAEINNRFTQDIDNFAAELIPQAEEYFAETKSDGWRPFPYEIWTRVRVNTLTNEIASITIDYYQYTGGAHGFTDRRSYNYNLRTGRELLLQDLFAPETDYISLITKQVKEQIGDSPDYWDFDSIDPDQPFYFKDGQIRVYFGLYEITPYAAGFPEFIISAKS